MVVHAFNPNTWDHTAYVINGALRSRPSTSKMGGRLGMQQNPYLESPSLACSSGFSLQHHTQRVQGPQNISLKIHRWITAKMPDINLEKQNERPLRWI